jgi:hypothetical protein
MTELPYKGYIIEALPEQLLENKKWTININIWKHRGGNISQKPFSAPNTFVTKEEAIESCFNFGKQIIDGQIENCTVVDL